MVIVYIGKNKINFKIQYFRAIVDQIQFQDEKENFKDLDYLKVRKLISNKMKENPNEYMPFLEGIDGEMMNENKY